MRGRSVASNAQLDEYEYEIIINNSRRRDDHWGNMRYKTEPPKNPISMNSNIRHPVPLAIKLES